MSRIAYRPAWQDVRSDSKRCTLRLDPHHDRPAIELRLSHRSTTLHLDAQSCREMAERLLTLARIVDNLEPGAGHWRRRGAA